MKSTASQKFLGGVIGLSIVTGWCAGENWLLRAVAVVTLLISFLAAFIPLIASRRFAFVSDGSRLAKSGKNNLRRVIEMFARLISLALVLFTGNLLLRIFLDLFDTAKQGRPVRATVIVDHVYSNGLTWWIYNSIDVETSEDKLADYALFLYPTRPLEGRKYEAVLLPKSECVLALSHAK